MKKAPPPYSNASDGNLHTFPKPTANPTEAYADEKIEKLSLVHQ